MQFTDTHAHYFDRKFDVLPGGAQGVLNDPAFRASVRAVINIGTNLQNSREAVAQAARYPFMAAAVGIHPEDCQVYPGAPGWYEGQKPLEPEEELPRLRTFFHKPVIANISGFSVEEYAYCCERIDREEGIGLIEVNVSCPNVRHGGMSFGTSPECAAEVTRAVKAVTTKPVYIKLSPNVTDIVAIACACEEAGADGLCLINTMLGMRIDVQRRKPVIANVMGGFSGDAVFPVALRMVYQVAGACGIPVIGCGGVSSARDVIEMMMAGATAVEVGAANLKNPYICKEIIEALPSEMERLGIERLADIVGCAAR